MTEQEHTDLPTDWRVEIYPADTQDEYYVLADTGDPLAPGDAMIHIVHAKNIDGRDIRARLARQIALHFHHFTNPPEETPDGD